MISYEELKMENEGAVKCFEYAWGVPPKDINDLRENFDRYPSDTISSILGHIYTRAGERDYSFVEIPQDEMPFVFQTGYWPMKEDPYTGKERLVEDKESASRQADWRMKELSSQGYIVMTDVNDSHGHSIWVAITLKGLIFLQEHGWKFGELTPSD